MHHLMNCPLCFLGRMLVGPILWGFRANNHSYFDFKSAIYVTPEDRVQQKTHVQGHPIVVSVHGGGGRERFVSRAFFSSVWLLVHFYKHIPCISCAIIRIQMKPLSREAELIEEAFFAMWIEYKEMDPAWGAPKRWCIRVHQRNKHQEAYKEQNLLYGSSSCDYGG